MTNSRILVWDLPTRLFHWLLAASFAGAWLTAESERLRDLHVLLGYTFAGLIAFRLIWGLAGSRYARFSSFVAGPRSVFAYLRSLFSRAPQHHIGHNPAGGWAILAMLGLGIVTAVTGYLTFNDLGGHALEEAHELAASAMLALVVVHILGVLVSSLIHRENLVRAMVTGYKRGTAGEGIRRTGWIAGTALGAAVLALWSAALNGSLPEPWVGSGVRSEHAQHGDD
jgi:cytochrome b